MSAPVPLRVRRMEDRDLATVGALAGQLVRMHHAWDALRFLRPDDPERGYARWFATQLDADDVVLLVAEDEEGVAGYAYARIEPRSYDELRDACAKLHDVYVDERAWRRGAGEALVREVFRVTAEKGAPRVVLVTAVQNDAAQRLFQRMGFRATMLEMTREL